MTHGSLFSGIGGFDLASEWMGWENVFHCEIDPNLQAFLKSKWPSAKSFGDINHADFTEFRGRIDVLTGGFPCQPFSSAGLRKGEEDDRHLWPKMFEVIRAIRPCWIVGENVAGILTMERGETFRRMLDDLEREGYEVECYDLPAYVVGLQTMERHIWIVAKAVGQRFKRSEKNKNKNKRNQGKFQGTNQGTNQRWNISETRFRDVAERVSNRLAPNQREYIKAGGNAIPPLVAYTIFQAIEDSMISIL